MRTQQRPLTGAQNGACPSVIRNCRRELEIEMIPELSEAAERLSETNKVADYNLERDLSDLVNLGRDCNVARVKHRSLLNKLFEYTCMTPVRAKANGGEEELMRRLRSLQLVEERADQNVYHLLVRAYCGIADSPTISTWALACRFVVAHLRANEAVSNFLKHHGGIRGCADAARAKWGKGHAANAPMSGDDGVGTGENDAREKKAKPKPSAGQRSAAVEHPQPATRKSARAVGRPPVHADDQQPRASGEGSRMVRLTPKAAGKLDAVQEQRFDALGWLNIDAGGQLRIVDLVFRDDVADLMCNAEL